LEIPYGTILLTVILIQVQKGVSAQISQHLGQPTSKDLGTAKLFDNFRFLAFTQESSGA
jgi:hypothetical protein